MVRTDPRILEGKERAFGPCGRAERFLSAIPDALSRSRGASQAASAAPTLRYGPAGDSAPLLRLSGVLILVLGWVLLSVRLSVPLRYGVRRLFSVLYL